MYLIQKSVMAFLFIWIAVIPSTAQQLISSTYLESRTKEELGAAYNIPFNYDVDLYEIIYKTVDVQGQADTASGLFVVPQVSDKQFPLLCYQHGTVDSRRDVPSRLQGGWDLAAVMAGFGYASIAPDYLGLGTSRGLHPYVHADSEAWVAVDMLRAVKEIAVANESINLNDQLFIMGYSQGGHAAMALHRALELEHADEFTVTASVPMSGPYSISTAMKELILSDEEYLFPAYVMSTVLSYDLVYGLFTDLEEYFKPTYLTVIENYKKETFSLFTANNFLVGLLKRETGTSIAKAMFQDELIEALENDPNHPLNIALKDNDVYDWTPKAPTRLLYCTADEQVAFRNSVIADSVMTMNGATDVEAINVSPESNHGECVLPAMFNLLSFFSGFQQILSNTEVESGQKMLKPFPNPTNDLLHFEEVAIGNTFLLYDIQGKLIMNQKIQNTSLDVSSLQGGLYVWKIKGKAINQLGELMIQP